MLSEGDIIDGKYKIVARIGSGNQGTVYAAKDLRLGMLWAIKEILLDGEEFTGDKTQMIQAEVMTLKSVKNVSLPLIIDYFKTEYAAYIVMEFIEGETLESILLRKKVLKPSEALHYGTGIAQGLKALHSMTPPIIYADLKPSNIMVTKEGNVKLIDFGATMFTFSKVFGTYEYAAPEQLSEQQKEDRDIIFHVSKNSDNNYDRISERADIYSFGLVFYEMLMGDRVHRKKIAGNVDCIHQLDHPMQIEQKIELCQPIVSDSILQILERCLRLNPKERFASGMELHARLEESATSDKNEKTKMILHHVLFFVGVILLTASFVVAYLENQKFFIVSFVLWCITYYWYGHFCRKKRFFYKGDRFRIVESGKKYPGLLLLSVIVIAAIVGSLSINTFATDRSKSNEIKTMKMKTMTQSDVEQSEQEKDCYGRKILIKKKTVK